MNPAVIEDEIEATPCPLCPICGSPGKALHRELGDRVFDAPGTWSLKQCDNRECGVLWLDPMPTPADVWKAYRTYYTHADHYQGPTKNDLARHLFRSAMSVFEFHYLARTYGYTCGIIGPGTMPLGVCAYAMPWRRTQWDVSVMFLPARLGGKLLEIGCGSGEQLKRFRMLGWDASGIDVDPVAIENAAAQGLPVTLGTLESQCYPAGHFDAITMCHVIEHVHHPGSLIRECYRILKPGGRLSIVTPNADAFLHRVFGKSWFPLEPPRHLHIFTRNATRAMLSQAGFRSPRVFTSVRDADGLFVASRSIRRSGRTKMRSRQPYAEKVAGRFGQILEWMLLKVDAGAGEELGAVAVKD